MGAPAHAVKLLSPSDDSACEKGVEASYGRGLAKSTHVGSQTGASCCAHTQRGTGKASNAGQVSTEIRSFSHDTAGLLVSLGLALSVLNASLAMVPGRLGILALMSGLAVWQAVLVTIQSWRTVQVEPRDHYTVVLRAVIHIYHLRMLRIHTPLALQTRVEVLERKLAEAQRCLADRTAAIEALENGARQARTESAAKGELIAMVRRVEATSNRHKWECRFVTTCRAAEPSAELCVCRSPTGCSRPQGPAVGCGWQPGAHP